MPTERPPFVGEVSANFLLIEDVAWSAQMIPTAVNLGFLDRKRQCIIDYELRMTSNEAVVICFKVVHQYFP
jgi:hypothetical protein